MPARWRSYEPMTRSCEGPSNVIGDRRSSTQATGSWPPSRRSSAPSKAPWRSSGESRTQRAPAGCPSGSALGWPRVSRSPSVTTSSAPRYSLPRGCAREPTPEASSSRAPCTTLRWARASPSAAVAGYGSKASTRRCPPSRSWGERVDRDDRFNGSDRGRGQLGFLLLGFSLLTACSSPGSDVPFATHVAPRATDEGGDITRAAAVGVHVRVMRECPVKGRHAKRVLTGRMPGGERTADLGLFGLSPHLLLRRHCERPVCIGRRCD